MEHLNHVLMKQQTKILNLEIEKVNDCFIGTSGSNKWHRDGWQSSISQTSVPLNMKDNSQIDPGQTDDDP